MNDVGILGFISIFTGIFLLMIKNFKKFHGKNQTFRPIFLLTSYALFASLIIEFFPLRSHGSFFSVWNASYLFFIIGILCGIYELEPKKFRNKRFDF